MKLLNCLCFLFAILSGGVLAQDNDLLTAGFHKGRREALRALLPDSSLAIIYSYPERNRSADVNYRYHGNPDLYYLTGVVFPDAVLFISKQPLSFLGKQTNELLLIPQPEEKEQTWTGKMISKKNALKISGLSMVEYSASTIDKLRLDSLPILKVFTPSPLRGFYTEKNNTYSLQQLLTRVENLTSVYISDYYMLNRFFKQLREVKQPEEIELMQKAVDASIEGHLRMIRAIAPGKYEYQLQAEGEYGFMNSGCEEPGYPSICGSGENSIILHYETNRRKMKDGDLVVLDMGGEYHGYSADITRTLPVSGTFSDAQKQIYELVRKAQLAGIAACKPGASFSDPHQAASEVIARGLLEAGIISNKDEYRQYFMHGTSHYLGLDVHDVGTHGSLKPGTVITVEPGIYISSGSNCDQKWWNIGIRIEDDVLITETGNIVLSGALPSTISEIEELIQKARVSNK